MKSIFATAILAALAAAPAAAAAEKLGVTESAFKARVQSARIRLAARTASEAIRKAREYRLL